MLFVRMIGLAIVFVLLRCSADANDINVTEVLSAIQERALENQKLQKEYGFHQETIIRKFKENGALKSNEKRLYQTVWILDEPYMRLVSIDGRELTTAERNNESRRRTAWIKTILKRREKPLSVANTNVAFNWVELHEKYDFQFLPPSPPATYVFRFQPKKGKLKERNRVERVMNHLTGTVWTDNKYNILKVEAELQKSVKYGLGIFAKIHALEISYSQQQFGDVWLPDTLRVKFKATLAMFKDESQQITNRYFNIFPRSHK